MKFSKYIFLALLAAALTSGALISSAPADEVIPATLTITNLRDESIVTASETSFFEGTTLRLTNCVLYAGTTTNSARQGLSQVTVELKAGNTTTSTVYIGTAQVASNGTWSCDAIVPSDSGTCFLQIKVTDSSTNSYIYPWKMLNHKAPL